MWNFFSKKLFLFLFSCFLVFLFIRKSFKEDVHPRAPTKYEGSIFFEEVSESMGLDYEHIGLFPLTRKKHREKRLNLYVGVPPSITVLDINRDGFPDLYVTYPVLGEKNLIYVNKDGRSFIRSEEYSSIKDANREFVSTRVAWFDFNNDGYEDIFVARYGCHGLYVYKPYQKQWSEHSNAVSYCSNSRGINIVDFNKDTYLDIVFANQYPKKINLNKEKPKWVSILSRGDNELGGENVLLTNQAGRFFLEDEVNKFQYKNHSVVVGVSDINNDTWPDIFIGNDFGYDRLYINKEGILEEETFSWLEKQKHGFSTMNADFVDLNNDLFPDLYTTNIFNPPYITRYNLLWMNDSGRGFIEKGEELNVHKCGWAWGAKFADFDNDGDLDLVVGNGMFKGSQAQPNKYEWFHRIRKRASSPYLRKKLYKKIDMSTREFSGFQKTCLFENRGDKFSYISDHANIKDFHNSRSTIILDFNNDGKMDFLTGNYNDKIRLYKNVSQSEGNWVGFDIKNAKGAVALEAKVILFTRKGRKFMREIYPQNGFGGQNDWRVHFGLGADQPASLKIQYRDKTHSIELKKINEYIKVAI